MKNSKWYKEGFEAGVAGVDPACPYADNSPKCLIWREGFKAGVASHPVDTRLPPV